MSRSKKFPISKSTDWREELILDEFNILGEKGTELPFSGKYNNHFEKGIYKCKGCSAHCINPKINLTVTVAGQVMIWQYLVL